MSRKATNEYIGTRRRAYAQADRAKRMRILDEVCETTGYERKYANRLLTGTRKFRERKGRGKTYGDDVAEVKFTVADPIVFQTLQSSAWFLPSSRRQDVSSSPQNQCPHFEPLYIPGMLTMGGFWLSG